MYYDLSLLIVRLVIGLLMAGHGAQKLFGWFEGPGLAGITGWLGSTGMRPAAFWAFMAGLSEFGGGLLFALGLLSPLGNLGIIAAMIMAIVKGHWGKGPWANKGGWELALTYLVIALALAFIGPGAYSLDAVLGIALPEPISALGGLVLVIIGVAVALLGQAPQKATSQA
ncbi:MAG: DoxX family protein [Chloroflexi bacterium]|nr:DoxX family protein [Chloroflexota bacterium]